MNKQEQFKRYTLFIISLFFSAMGVALTKHGELGVSPISSVANVLSLRFSFFSLGTWLIIWNCALIIGQIILLGKNFQLIQLLQVPLSFLFGYFTDFGMWCVSFLPADLYIIRLICIVLGTIVLGFGIALSVIANVIMNAGEAFVKALSDRIHADFGKVKIGFDISCVLLALLLSLVFFHFTIVGTREGTVIAALSTGVVVIFFRRILGKPIGRMLTSEKSS